MQGETPFVSYTERVNHVVEKVVSKPCAGGSEEHLLVAVVVNIVSPINWCPKSRVRGHTKALEP